jgi:prepilin-type N-terminal cleavage/methylation domain-containing protein
MKRAFTLIELLVVIAIIAILAAILFPVFAQAKTAAKKATSLSNQKQIGLAIIQYAESYDDTYPRNDDCQAGQTLNTALKNLPYNPAGVGCKQAPFYFRMNHYKWQIWVMPYVKNVDIFIHPVIRPLDNASPRQWSQTGEIYGAYALNLALTGALNTYNTNPGASGRFRESFLGGKQTAIQDVAGAMLIMELVHPSINYAPVFLDGSSGIETRTAYPFAVREAWMPYLLKTDSNCVSTSEVASTNVPFANQINLSYADGHSKSIHVNQFLANTPPAAEYQVSSRPACGMSGGAWTISSAPVWTRPWPMWALQ